MIHNITIVNGDYTYHIDVESTNCKDIFTEACTLLVEKLVLSKNLKLSPIMICWKLPDKHKSIPQLKTVNVYKILINAGFHTIAEEMRKQVYNQSNIDWATEPVISK